MHKGIVIQDQSIWNSGLFRDVGYFAYDEHERYNVDVATTTARLKYRPLRIGFCVKGDSLDDVVKAVQLNSLLYAGIYNPIIPVTDDTMDCAKNLVKVFDVDFLYAVSRNDAVQKFIAGYPYLKCNYSDEASLFENSGTQKTLTVLDIRHLLHYFWEKEFKNRKISNACLPVWDSNDERQFLFAVLFGDLSNNHGLTFPFKDRYLKALRAKEIKLSGKKTLSDTLPGKVTPIGLTSCNSQLFGGRIFDNGIYVGDVKSPEDLINFWNLRAVGLSISFVPSSNTKDYVSFVKKELSRLPDKPDKSDMGLLVWHKTKDEDNEVKRVAELVLEPKVRRVYAGLSSTSWNGLNIVPCRVELESFTVLCNIDDPDKSAEVSAQLPTKKYLLDDISTSNQRLVVDFDISLGYVHDDLTLKVPPIRELTQWYSRNMCVDPYDLCLSKSSVGKVIKLYEETLHLYPIRHLDIVQRIFSYCGIEARPSRAGQIAQRLVEAMGGLEEFRVFKIKGVRKLLSMTDPDENMAYSRMQTIVRDVGDDSIPSFDSYKGLFIQRRNKPSLSVDEVISFLINKNVFRSGLEPVCPNCEMRFWIGLNDCKDIVSCNYCGHTFNLAAQMHSMGDFRFRKSGLFGRRDNQEGSIPVLLTMLQLSRRYGLDRSIKTTALKLDAPGDGINCEVDLCEVSTDPWDNEVQVLLSECKTTDEITDTDIANLEKVGCKLKTKGIHPFLLFSKTVSFTQDEIERFKGLQTRGLSPILFSDVELEPFEPYEHYWDNNTKLPEPYTHSYDGMARNSAAIYLN